MEQKEKSWRLERSGLVTSSGLAKLFTGGREPLSAQERELGLYGKNRTTKDVEFGEVAKTYLLGLVHEVKRGKPLYSRELYNFDWGHQQEPMAVKWLRANTMFRVLSCAEDFESIVFNVAGCGLGDSPDFYADDSGIGEIKCPVSEAKFEEALELTPEEALQEYRLQLAGHLLAAPWADRLHYLIYNGQNDDDPFDTLDPLAPERGILFTYYRHELSDDCEQIRKKVLWTSYFVQLAATGAVRVRDVNHYWQYSSVEDLKELLGRSLPLSEKYVRPY